MSFRYLLKFAFLFLSLIGIANAYSQVVVAQDGTNYHVVQIGGQQWLQENLNVATFDNGIPIKEAKTLEEWNSLLNQKLPAFCYEHLDPKNAGTLGKIYNWYALRSANRLAPIGWHIPANDEWDALVKSVGNTVEAQCLSLKSTIGWNARAAGNNKSKFSALAGGGVIAVDFHGQGENGHSTKFTFAGLGNQVFFWSSTWRPNVGTEAFSVSDNNKGIGVLPFNIDDGFYVRCVKD